MQSSETGQPSTHKPGDDRTHEPGDHQPGGGGSGMTLDAPLAEEDVHTQEQRNQDWTKGSDESDPRRHEGEPLRTGSEPADTLPRPQDLEEKLDEVMANPHSDAQDTSDTQGQPGPLGGMPKTGSGDQDPMSQAQGSGSE